MSTKADINTIFKSLERFGYKVKSFGDNRRGRKASKSWVDNIIFNRKYFICVETKTEDTKDRLSEGQKETAELLSNISTLNKTFYYFQIKNDREAMNLRDRILENNL